jgi:phytoene synthase
MMIIMYTIQSLWQLCYRKPMDENYCQTLVRTQDPDRFLISLFFPPEKRAHLWALYALNHEIARTREVVTDTHMGLIRLQWWRDALAAFYDRNEVGPHAIMEDLSKTIWRYDLPRPLFDHLIYAREFDLEDRAPGSLEGLCNYADFTHAPLLRLSLIIAGEDPDHSSVQPVAMAYAMTGLIRAVPFHAAQGRVFLPEGVHVAAVRGRAEELLRQASPAGEGAMLRLHRVMTQQYINKIKGLNDNANDPRLGVPPLFRQIKLWRAARK